MPGPGMDIIQMFATLFSEPVFEGLISSFITDFFSPKRDIWLEDESIKSFFTRRLSPKIADNLASAIIHGIYAGDIEQLSMRSIFPQLWDMEERYGSLNRAIRRNGSAVRHSVDDDRLLSELAQRPPQSDRINAAEAASVFTLKGGLGELAYGLEARLQASPMIQVERRAIVESLQLKGSEPNGHVRFARALSDLDGLPLNAENPLTFFAGLLIYQSQ